VGIFPEGEDSCGDRGLGRLVEFRFKGPPGTTPSYITTDIIGTTQPRLMGVPTSEVGYTSAMPRREDHEVQKDVGALGGGGRLTSFCREYFVFPVSVSCTNLVNRFALLNAGPTIAALCAKSSVTDARPQICLLM